MCKVGAQMSDIGSSREWASVRLRFNPLVLFDAEVFLIFMEAPSILSMMLLYRQLSDFSVPGLRVCGGDAQIRCCAG